MLSITGILFIAMGCWCVFIPEIVGMFDGFTIKPSTNEYYHNYIKRVGLAFIIVGIGEFMFGMSTVIFGEAWLHVIKDFVNLAF